MSAIAGLMNLTGAPVPRRDVERMISTLSAHGPDRTEVITAGPVGLAHALMRITPEDRFEKQPLQGASGVWLTADLRLDNRDEMLDRIGVNRADGVAWPDSRVLLVAWEKLGNDAWPLLRGPFAAAIWNPRERALTLARDHLGLNPLMWHKGDGFLAFATMPKALLALPEVPRDLNEEKIADFLVLNFNDHAATMYRGVQRLPPAHVATIGMDGAMEMRRYWSAAEVKPVRLSSDEAYAEGLRDRLDRAVRRQLRSITPVASHLSGGLDSSAIAAMAARALGEHGQRLAAFTQVPRKGFDGRVHGGRYADETPFVEAIKAMLGNIDVTYVHNDEVDDFADLDRVQLAFEYPVLNPTNLGWVLAIPRLARAQNRRVLLAGDHGNFTISWSGWSQSVDHLRNGRLMLAWQQYGAFYRSTKYSRWIAFRKLFLDRLWSDRILDWYDRRRGNAMQWQSFSAIRPEFASETGVEARARRNGHDFRYRVRPGERFSALTLVDCMGEWYAALKAMYGVEIRIPVADIDLIEYCFGVPQEQYLIDGIDRSLIRRAMWGLLPAVVLTNRRSGLQGADWYEKVAARRELLKAEIVGLSGSRLATRALDLERMQRALDDWPAEGWHRQAVNDEHQLVLTRGLSVGRFLRWADAQNR